MSSSGLLSSFLAAIQASMSVLLVISYGGIAAHFNLLNSSAAKSISKISVKMFLPALLITKIGSELHAGSADRYVIILIWAFACHLLSFLIGSAAHIFFGMPDWITAAIMFNNTTSYPLLLVQALDETGVLNSLITTDETTTAAIERAKSYFLVFATISSCLTFAVGPRLIDSEHAPEPDDKEEETDDNENIENGVGSVEESAEQTPLLASRPHRASVPSVSFFPSTRPPRESSAVIFDRRPSIVGRKRWLTLHPRTKWWLLFFFDFLNAPLLGAAIGAVIGLIPALHRAFFNNTTDGGIFMAWLTASWKTIGQLFVPLPVVIAGISLYTSIKKARSATEGSDRTNDISWLTTLFVLVVRFVIWPVISIAFIYVLVQKTDLLGSDPMLWFAMMLMPTGPSAMKLITMVEVSDGDEEDEHKIAKLLTISYIISPVLAFTVVGSLRASQAGIGS